MTVNLAGGIDYTQWKPITAPGVAVVKGAEAGQKIGEYINDEFVSSEKCTDGKDDGKIGFFSAIGNAIKGVGKTIVNGVKGMFTDKEGKFSLGKTLLSIGTAALCIAVPAVGVAACAVGATIGAVKVGKGIHKAANAETDAEAKQAWQEIGGGTFTVAASVVGAKAGMKAVGKTSTATNGLASLGKDATIAQKAAAFGRDAVSSTKNGIGSIKTAASNAANSATGQKVINAAKHPVQTAKNAVKSDAGRKVINTAKDAGDKVVEAAKHPVQTAKTAFNFAKENITKENIGKAYAAVKDQLGKVDVKKLGGQVSATKATIIKELQAGKTAFADIVSKYGFEEVSSALKYLGGIAVASAEE